MDTKLSTNRRFKRMLANILSIFVVLAMAFPAMRSAFAQDESPYLRAFPDQDSVDGSRWPAERSVSLTINDTTFESQISNVNGYVIFDLDGYDLKRGDTLAMSSEGVSPVFYTARQLIVDNINLDSQTVSGTVDGQQTIHFWVGEIADEYVDSDGNGNWSVDLSSYEEAVLTPGTCGQAEAWDASGEENSASSTIIDWCVPEPPPNPHFTVFPDWEFFDGLEWLDGSTVAISVEGKPECSTEKESWDGFFNGNFGEGCDLVFGDTVTFDDGTTTRTHVVRDLYVTNVDTSENTVTGKADAGETVYVWPHDGWFEPLQTIVGESGLWQVDLDVAGYTIREDSEGRSEIRDEMGNATASDWHVTHPRFTVFPEWEWFDGNDWPNGATVTITVEGKKDVCTTEGTSWNYFFNGGFPEGCDVVVGDVVIFTYGETERTHTVQNLTITKANQDDDIIKGIADPGAEVYVWPHATGEQQIVTANPKGKWEVDFTGIYDLMTGDGGRAEARDEFGNATAVDWYVPQPRFTIYPDAQWFDGNDWPDGATVTITIKKKPECTFAMESWGGFINGGFPEGCVVVAGDRVTFTDGTTTRKHTVQNLAIVRIDKDTDIVFGIADTGAVIHTWVWSSDGSTLNGSNLEVTAMDGMWQADFGALGIDLAADMGVQAEIRDENGNATSVDHGTFTRMVASITENWLYVVDFDPVATLNLSISSSQGDLIWQGTRTTDMNGFAWIDSEGWDLIPGNYLVVSDGNTTKDLVIEGFTFDVFDLSQGLLQGTATEPFGRSVFVGIGCWDREDWTMEVMSDDKGAWAADFGAPVPNDYGCVYAQIFDADGDASELRPDRILDLWAAAYTFELPAGSWNEGQHTFHFEWNGSPPDPGTSDREFTVSGDAPSYDGYVLLGGPGARHGSYTEDGLVCEAIDTVHPDQPTRFIAGWVTDYAMTYGDSLAYFDGVTASVVWDDGQSAELVRHEIFLWSSVDWAQYSCTFTAP